MWKNLIIVLCICSVISCQRNSKTISLYKSTNQYALRFNIQDLGEFKKLTVLNPFEQAQNIQFDYYLFKKGDLVPDSLSGQKIIFTPVERIICLSTTHIAFIDIIDETDKIVGVSGSQYVNNQKVRKLIENETIVDVGYGENLNYELILQQKPDLVMIYGVGSEVSSNVRKIEDIGLNVILNAEYLEEDPLGKAEWIKFVSALFEKEELADDFFFQLEEKYNNLKKMAVEEDKPKVIVGLPFNGSWWVPGGKSYMAKLINDAGGDYLGKNNESSESYVISFENALLWAEQANTWLNPGSVNTKNEIAVSDVRFNNFKVFSEGVIFNNNKIVNHSGGNDFWESGTVYPDLILRDLIKIFYPDKMEDVPFIYYKEIN